MKQSGKRSAGNPHAAFDVAGAGNVMMVAGLRPIAKAMDQPPEPKVRAPVLDPTYEGGSAYQEAEIAAATLHFPDQNSTGTGGQISTGANT